MTLATYQRQLRIFGLIVLLIAVLAGTIFAGQKISGMFARASQCTIKNVTVDKVVANSAVVNWDTEDETQGLVTYGTTSTNLNISAPEGTSGIKHSIPLTLLTPNTVYYYLISAGNNKCDSSGVKCDTSCVPWSFTTVALVPPDQTVEPLVSPTSEPEPTEEKPTIPSGPSPTSALSLFCQQVKANIGKSSADSVNWPNLKKLDIDDNGVINGVDVIKCTKAGK